MRRAAGLVAALALIGSPLAGQASIGSGADYQGYHFGTGLGPDAASLLIVPVALRIPFGQSLSVDLYSAYADGRVWQNNRSYRLKGPVDTNVRMSYQATPWALISVGANVPTGNGTHDADEAVVASVLSTDILGFRQATWGTGFAVTSSLATATTAGGFGLGIAGAYSVRGEFEPSTTQQVTYKPGSEARVRVGIDRNFGTSTLTLGGTFINYQQDQANGANLFQAGNRLRFDGSFAFRSGAGVWTLYGAGLVRENGDLTLDIVDNLGNIVGDTAVVTAKQTMIVGGLMGTLSLGGGFVFRPHIDFKAQTREEPDGSDPGSGWMVAAGGDIPIRILGGYDFFPKARVFYGAIRDAMGADASVFGMEFKGTMRLRF